jgi:hypothetical protein
MTKEVYLKRTEYDHDSIKDWCRDHIGSDWRSDEMYGHRFWLDEVIYSFADRSDAALFLLRWS